MAHDVFLSYSNKDKVAAETVSRALEASGVRVWMAPRDFFPGLDWAESIRAAMDQGRFFVLVFSSRANASEHTLLELDYAVSHGKPVIPFRIEDVKPSGRMASLLAVSHTVGRRFFAAPGAACRSSGGIVEGNVVGERICECIGAQRERRRLFGRRFRVDRVSVAAARKRSRASAREETGAARDRTVDAIARCGRCASG